MFTPENVPIIIPCSHRPEFLIECLNHLNDCDLINEFTVWFSIDSKFEFDSNKSKDDHYCVLDYVSYWNSSKETEYYIHIDNENPIFNSVGAINNILDKTGAEAFIYIEEDVIVSRCFLRFCLDALNFYKDNQNVLMIAGHNENSSDKTLPAVAELSEKVTCSVLLGVAGWANKWKWIKDNLKSYCEDPNWIISELKKSVLPEVNCHVRPDGTMRNRAGGGLVTANMIINGQVCLVPDIALANHIGFYGWHIPKETADPNDIIAFSKTFHKDNEYSSDFLEIGKGEIMEAFGFA